jgi:hypothetical protein
MSAMKKLIWIAGAILVAASVAFVRGAEIGFEWDLFPKMVSYGFAFASPIFLVILFRGEGSLRKRVSSCGALFVLGFFVGISYVGFEDFTFRQNALSQESKEFHRRRWWPFSNYSLLYREGVFNVIP